MLLGHAACENMFANSMMSRSGARTKALNHEVTDGFSFCLKAPASDTKEAAPDPVTADFAWSQVSLSPSVSLSRSLSLSLFVSLSLCLFFLSLSLSL